MGTPEEFSKLPERSATLRRFPARNLPICKTPQEARASHGSNDDQSSLMSNLMDISVHGVKVRQDDQCVSWLPFYHDMGLVGLLLTR
jgi:fatty-acyl-CoA synthase